MIDVKESWHEQVEQSIQAANIGGKIRRLRLKRSMGLVELGLRTGLSASFLSQLETGRVVPTLRNLSRIALTFGQDLNYFFEMEQRNLFRISRGKVRSRLKISKGHGEMISESMRVLVPDQSVVPCIAEFPLCDAPSSFFPEIFEGEEFVYLLAGSLLVKSSAGEATLDFEDVLWVDGGVEREYRCEAGQTARVVIITCPRQTAGGRVSMTAATRAKGRSSR
ncbi:MAG TPA: XRE family transcriptional regulator [Acidobacteriaceae bacterium]